MKNILKHLTILFSLTSILCAQTSLKKDLAKQKPTDKPATPSEINQQHEVGSKKTANDQDELSADVQDLIQEQTDDKVIELLEEAEKLMAEATDNLEIQKTDGTTIAIETEIIERIYEAAKQKQKSKSEPQEGQPQPSNGMMEMMKQMMGKQPGEGEQPSEQPGEQAGNGQEGNSDKSNDHLNSASNEGNKTTRRIPKSSGTAGTALPRELHKALDAFNKAASEKK